MAEFLSDRWQRVRLDNKVITFVDVVSGKRLVCLKAVVVYVVHLRALPHCFNHLWAMRIIL